MLTDTGHTDLAYRLLTQRTFPSWGYQIDRGATTMWERWDSLRPDGTFQDASMNSFNHYAYGSVGQWMYANIAGISAARPGYREVLIRPRPGGGVDSARATFRSVRGPISTRWSRRQGRFELTCSVPPNTTAEVWIPAAPRDKVTHSGGTPCATRTATRCSAWARAPTASRSEPPRTASRAAARDAPHYSGRFRPIR